MGKTSNGVLALPCLREGANKSCGALACQGDSESRQPFAGMSGSVRKG